MLEQFPGSCPVTAPARALPLVIPPPVFQVALPEVPFSVLRDEHPLDELVQLVQVDIREDR